MHSSSLSAIQPTSSSFLLSPSYLHLVMIHSMSYFSFSNCVRLSFSRRLVSLKYTSIVKGFFGGKIKRLFFYSLSPFLPCSRISLLLKRPTSPF